MDRKLLYVGIGVLLLLLAFVVVGAIAKLLLKLVLPLLVIAVIVAGILWLLGKGSTSGSR